MTKQAGEPGLEDLRAQRDAIDRQLAQAMVGPTEAFMALMGGEEVAQILDDVNAVAAPLDDATRGRIEQWIKLHGAIVKLGGLELARLRKLVG